MARTAVRLHFVAPLLHILLLSILTGLEMNTLVSF